MENEVKHEHRWSIDSEIVTMTNSSSIPTRQRIFAYCACGAEMDESEMWKTLNTRVSDSQGEGELHTCDFCKWTNVSSNLNIGEDGKSLWICHGCVKRLYEDSRALSSLREENERLGERMKEAERNGFINGFLCAEEHGDTNDEQFETLKRDAEKCWEIFLSRPDKEVKG